MSQRVTKPFPADTTPLADRPGVYQREIGGHWRYAFWNGSQWFQSTLLPEVAAMVTFPANTWTAVRWRGLAEQTDVAPQGSPDYPYAAASAAQAA